MQILRINTDRLKKAACLLSFVYLFIAYVYFYFFTPASSGDEWLFVSDLDYIKAHGWMAAVEKSISVPYMIISLPFSFIMENYVALRLTNFLLVFFLLIYFFKIAKIRSLYFYGYLSFFLATSAVFCGGTNDTLFFISLIIFFSEAYLYIVYRKMNNTTLAFTMLVVAIFTRELVFVYFPALILAFFFLYKTGFRFFQNKMLLPFAVFCLFVTLNIPCLQSRGKLSYDDKVAPSSLGVNWRQRQYLAQLMVNEGKLDNFQHPSWDETRAYLDKHGNAALPRTLLEGITFDYKMTATEFVKDFGFSLFFGFRQLALMLFFPFIILFARIYKRDFRSPDMFIPLIMLSVMAILSLIVVSYIEPRWFIGIFVPAILFYYMNQRQGKVRQWYLTANYVLVIIFAFYGMYGIAKSYLNNHL